MQIAQRGASEAGGETMAARRKHMVSRQIAGRGVSDRRVREAMLAVPREVFVPAELAEFAYEDTPLPIGADQTISQPFIVAMMLEAAEISPGEKVLDVGTGSGYAAALASRIAGKVVSIERHAELTHAARDAIDGLGYDNIDMRIGDGTQGAADEAPFDAILVAAGGPEIPAALVEHLAPGGRLIIPVGPVHRYQHLLRIRKTGDNRITQEDLGPVAFVPLIGAGGWRGPASEEIAHPTQEATQKVGAARPIDMGTTNAPTDPAALIARHAEPLPEIGVPAFGAMFDRIGDARVVAIGEATHGTSEFYRARAAITRHLIEEHGFNIVTIEADWPDAAIIDRHVRGLDSARATAQPFARFPIWMWRNEETRDFVEWLRHHNQQIDDPGRRVSFHGLDLYSMDASVRSVIDYLDRVDPEAATTARARYGCLSPWQRDPVAYGRAALHPDFQTCESDVVAMLSDMLEKRLEYAKADGESYVDAAQNARLVAAAEHYYRAMYYGPTFSWNLRDTHMFETLLSMIKARGPHAKAVVWAHNSHIGDASATEMGALRDQLNIGQLCREKFGRDAVLVGFGTDSGTVAAADDWDQPMQIMNVRPARSGSYEAMARDAPTDANFLLDLRPENNEELRQALSAPRLERAIGVIYRPETEYESHYFEASLPAQFDLYLWYETTRAVKALSSGQIAGSPDTYPFGL